MSTRSQLTKDLNESVKSLLGKRVKILLKNVVKLETKGDKTENRVLVFSPCRLFLLTAKVPTRFCLTVNDKIYSFLTTEENSSGEVDAMIQALATAIRNIFPTVPLTHVIRKVEVVPPKRIQFVRDAELAMRHGSEDVDTIYLSHDTRELCLQDFDHLDPKDLVPIISALEYNTWFTKLRASNIKLSHEALDRILHVMKRTLSIEELYLDNLGLKSDFSHKLSLSLIANPNLALHTLDLSNNLIEDKAANHLASPLAKIPKGLINLSLSRCGLSSKGINQLAHALSLNKCMPTTLTHLNISDNYFKDDVTNLCSFLAQPNTITHLDISRTDCPLETVFGALLRGCSTNLAFLNVSHNVFSTKKSKELPPSFKQFFISTLSLKHINMSYCKLPLDALKNLLLGLACNESTTDIILDISCNNLGSQGAHVLESCIHGVRSIGALDISDNNMDVELAAVITAVSKNKSIKHFHLGRNMNNMKAKHIVCVMDALVTMIQEESCVLQTLSIPDSKLKSDLYTLINALGSNQCLQSIDISGNYMGDAGARLLGKALQINSHIRSILYDRNNITLQGYHDLAYALESNYTVRYMPLPLFDVMPCMKLSAEKTDAIMKKIQDVLHRNVSPKKYSNGQAFRLQQGFLLSSTQQMVDRLVVQMQDTIKTLVQETTDKNDEINYATGLIEDADNSKQLLPRLHEVVLRKEEAGHPIDLKMKLISDELHAVIVNYLHETVESMMRCAQEQCPTILGDEKVQNEIRKTCRDKSGIDPEYLRSIILEQSGTHIINRVNELSSTVAAHVSDRVTDEVIDSLSKCLKSLLGENCRKRSSTPDVLRTMFRVNSDSSRVDSFTVSDSSQLSDPSPVATPHLSSKRKSLHGRKLRPKSVVDSVEGMSADDIPDLLPSLPTSAEGVIFGFCVRITDRCGQQLQHLVKGRPKRAKTRAPTRPTIKPQEGLEEGLDTFFRPGSITPTTPLVSPSSDDSAASSFAADLSPNNPVHKEKSSSTKSSKSSPLLSSVQETPRSRSSDNLEKYSPVGFCRVGDVTTSNCSAFSKSLGEKDEDTNRSDSIIGRISNSAFIKPNKSDNEKPDSPGLSLVKLRSTGLSGNNGFFTPKSPILKSLNASNDRNDNSCSKLKSLPPLAPKPRPKSMADPERKSGELSAYLNEGPSPGSETPDTPCVLTGEKKSVKELAANLCKQGSDSPDGKRKLDLGSHRLSGSRLDAQIIFGDKNQVLPKTPSKIRKKFAEDGPLDVNIEDSVDV
ncbi:unnamed protein product [Bemisia tabaci]|uniref:Leucine-rich repeat-containing protein 16A n=1 Tax=Bemisia tabaci TaxID=7038 RepID=A0A9P0A0M2_BEMTA|nr:unnamed protein product [Bemisia tabaci]